MATPAMTYAVLAPVVLLVLYRRLRRHIGRQPLRAWRIGLRLAGVCIAALALLLIGVAGALGGSMAGLGVLAGLAGGGLLGSYGLRLTRFETTPEGRFYTPNPWLGVGLSALMLGRLAYRFVVVRDVSQAVTLTDSTALGILHRSPLTLAIAGLLVGYFLRYSLGLWRATRTPAAEATLS
ncbi:MAG: DUF1453 domain-containing protein [Thermomonas sp.]